MQLYAKWSSLSADVVVEESHRKKKAKMADSRRVRRSSRRRSKKEAAGGSPSSAAKVPAPAPAPVDEKRDGAAAAAAAPTRIPHRRLFQRYRAPKTRKCDDEECLKQFQLFDDDKTGRITFQNLKRVAKELGEDITDEELVDMIDVADGDGDGEVNKEEFLLFMKKVSLD